MDDQSPRYMAFLLRLWCIDEGDSAVWRASLEDAHTGERYGFADLTSLFEFLKEQQERAKHAEGGTNGSQVDRKGRQD